MTPLAAALFGIFHDDTPRPRHRLRAGGLEGHGCAGAALKPGVHYVEETPGPAASRGTVRGHMVDASSRAKPLGEIELGAELREQLGLGASEPVRLLDAGVRTILLERCGGPESAALPWDHDLVFTANVRAVPLADLLGLVHGAGKSGFLFFTCGDHAKAVYFHRGEVVFASSNQRVDRLGECLLRAGVITLEQLREAERRFTPPDRFGKTLVERGFLTPRELWHGVKYQVEEIVRSLFSHTSGIVYFWEGDVQPDNVVRLSLPTRRLVAEGIQRRDELLKFLALLEDPRVSLAGVAGKEANLAGNERMLFDGLAAEGSFPALCRRVGIDPLSAARTVQLLRLVGAVKLVRTREDEGFLGEADLRRHDEETVRSAVTNHLKLLAELAAPIVAVEGTAPFARRFEPILEETAQRFPALLKGVAVGAGAALDPEELGRRALRLAGDREGQVAAALGELVAYVEFELMNHPGIQEPERFLAALEDLRASIEV